MYRYLMATDLVSQHGPNPQAGPRRPDRSVSLPDPRETAAEMMGGLGNLPLKRLQKQRDDLIDRYERLKPDSPNAPFNQELDELLEAIDEVERQIRELDPPPPPPPVEVLDLDDPAARKAALAKWGRRHVESVPDLPPDLSPTVSTMLASMTHAASGEPGRIGRSAPEGPTPPYEPAPPLTEEQKKLNREEIKKIRRDNPNIVNPESTMVPEESMLASIWGAITAALGQAGSSTLPHAQVGQAAMQQMQEMPPEDQVKIATLLLAGSAAASGIGGPLVPPILAGGAMLSSQ